MTNQIILSKLARVTLISPVILTSNQGLAMIQTHVCEYYPSMPELVERCTLLYEASNIFSIIRLLPLGLKPNYVLETENEAFRPELLHQRHLHLWKDHLN